MEVLQPVPFIYRVGENRFTFVCMENNTINETCINYLSCTHNCKPTFAPPCILDALNEKGIS